jgi:hypothetical protein
MNKMLKDVFTGLDNKTWDLGRVLWAAAFVVGVGLVVHGHIVGHDFDIQAYGVGIGSLLTGGGLGLKLKEGTEPSPATTP